MGPHVALITHDIALKIYYKSLRLTYFYFARYKPLHMDLTFWTVADLVQDILLALIPLIMTAATRIRQG